MDALLTCGDCGITIRGVRAYCDLCGILHRNPKQAQHQLCARIADLRARATDVLGRARTTVNRSNTARAALYKHRLRMGIAMD
jgi:hypothetical protein